MKSITCLSVTLLLLCLTDQVRSADQAHVRQLLDLAQQQASRITDAKHLPAAECYAYGQLGDTKAAMALWEQVDLPHQLWLVCETARGLAEAGYIDEAGSMLMPISKIKAPITGRLGYLNIDFKSRAFASLAIAQQIKGQSEQALMTYHKITSIGDQCFALSRITGYLADQDRLDEAQQWYTKFDDGRWRTYATQKLIACYVRKHGFDQAYEYALTFKDNAEVKEAQWQLIKMQIHEGQLDQAIVKAIAGFDNRKMQRELRQIARELIDADNIDLGLKVLNKLPEPVRWRTSLRERTAMAYVRKGDLKMAYQMVLSIGSLPRSQFFANLKICDHAAQNNKPEIAKQYYDEALKYFKLLENEWEQDVFHERLAVSQTMLGQYDTALTTIIKAKTHRRIMRVVGEVGPILLDRDQIQVFKKYLEKIQHPADQVTVLTAIAQSELRSGLLVEY
ncbi:MAG: hypothetical protein ACF8OB_19900 [Phycisphaeraceae bacterium JB051]